MAPAKNGGKMIIDFREKQDMLPRGTRLLCAVSGGADSMCLLHLMKSREAELGIQVFAAHYEHGLRGEESLGDCAFVENWCREKGILCVSEHGDVRAYAREKGMGTEAAARELRYAFLKKTAEELGCTRIATAHNAEDNAETLLLNLCRGSGAAGLRGIPPVRGNIIRPLLGCTRAEIEEYLRENHVPHVEDSSNAGDEYSRNLIRHRVTPALREINPAFSSAALRTAELMRRDEDCLSTMAEEFIRENFDGVSLPLEKLRALHPAVAGRVFRRLCPESLSLDQVDGLIRLAESNELAFADLPGIRLRFEQGRLYFGGEEPVSLPERAIVPGTVTHIPEAGLRIKASIGNFSEEINSKFKTYLFKCESICGNITCDSRRPGDKISPAGRNCTKSLKSLFLEAGMTQRERDLTPVIRDEKGIIAVYGLAVDRRCEAGPGDKVLRLDIEKEKTGR